MTTVHEGDVADLAARTGISPAELADAISRGVDQAVRQGLDLGEVVIVLSTEKER